MNSTYNEAKSVITEWFIKTLNAKIYKKWQLVITKSYLSYLNELVDQYNNTYHHGIKKKANNADYSEKIETNLKVLYSRLMIESKLLTIRISLVKITLLIGQEKHFLLILIWKPILELELLSRTRGSY